MISTAHDKYRNLAEGLHLTQHAAFRATWKITRLPNNSKASSLAPYPFHLMLCISCTLPTGRPRCICLGSPATFGKPNSCSTKGHLSLYWMLLMPLVCIAGMVNVHAALHPSNYPPHLLTIYRGATEPLLVMSTLMATLNPALYWLH
jgi:hypothetical protein